MSRQRSLQGNGCLSLILNIFNWDDQKDTPESLPYRRRDSILTRAEHSFYLVLFQALENKVAIIPKVGLQDVFFIVDNGHYQTSRNRIAQRHVDFLICEPSTMRPLFGIELDDSSHNQERVKQSDAFKNMVFEAAMLPLVRIPLKHNFNVDELKETLQPYFIRDAEKNPPPICPNCGIPMVIKTAKKGNFKGEDFYACPNYPKCKKKKNIFAVT